MNWKISVVRGIEVLFLGIGSYFDIKTRKLPLRFLLLFAGIGVVINLVWKYQSIRECALGCGFGLMFFVLSKITKEAIGFGDAWGILILGIFQGWKDVILTVFAGFLLGSLWGVCKMVVFKKTVKDTMPFFPFLFLARLGGWML